MRYQRKCKPPIDRGVFVLLKSNQNAGADREAILAADPIVLGIREKQDRAPDVEVDLAADAVAIYAGRKLHVGANTQLELPVID